MRRVGARVREHVGAADIEGVLCVCRVWLQLLPLTMLVRALSSDPMSETPPATHQVQFPPWLSVMDS